MATRQPVIFTHTIGAEAAPLFAGRLIADVDVVADPDNEDPVTLEAASGSIELAPGQGTVFIGCDLSKITVDGTEGEKLKVSGNTNLHG